MNKQLVGKHKFTLLRNCAIISCSNPLQKNERLLFDGTCILLNLLLDDYIYCFKYLNVDSAAQALKDDYLDDVFHEIYLPGDSIGTGSYANVHQVTCKTTGLTYAAKIINKRKMEKKHVIKGNMITDPSIHIFAPGLHELSTFTTPLSPFLGEFEVMQCVTDHPNTIHPQQAIETASKAYLVME